MEVSLSELEKGPLDLEFEAPLTRLEGRAIGGPIRAWARIELKGEQVALKGNYQVLLACTCDRCPRPLELPVTGELELLLVQSESQEPASDDQEFSLEGPDQDYFTGNQVLLDTYFEDQLILDLPLQILCQEECLGLCGRCGGDLKLGQCTCPKWNPDSPFAVLKDLINPKDS